MNQKELDRQWALIERARKLGCDPRTAKSFFVDECRRTAHYWADAEGMDKEDACLGVVHSILTMLDGRTLGAPSYAVRPIDENAKEGDDIAGELGHRLQFVRGKSPQRHPRPSSASTTPDRLLRELIICTETLLGYVPKWARNTTLNVDFIQARVRAANEFLGRTTGRPMITNAPKPLPLRRVRGAKTLPPAANIERTAPAARKSKMRNGGVH